MKLIILLILSLICSSELTSQKAITVDGLKGSMPSPLLANSEGYLVRDKSYFIDLSGPDFVAIPGPGLSGGGGIGGTSGAVVTDSRYQHTIGRYGKKTASHSLIAHLKFPNRSVITAVGLYGTDLIPDISLSVILKTLKSPGGASFNPVSYTHLTLPTTPYV